MEKEEKQQTEIITKSKNMGLASTINVECSCCSKVFQVDSQSSKYANSKMQGTVSSRENSSWYDLNFKLTLGTLASGLGAANVSELFYFLCIPQAKTFHKRLFSMCE